MTALIVVDVQRAFDDPSWGQRNNPDAESNVERLLAAWRAAEMPVVHVRHRSTGADGLFVPGRAAYEFKREAMPLAGEPVVTKNVNSAFIGTDLEERLRTAEISDVVICGLTTDHCVSTTVRMAGNLGFDTTVVSDATATFDRIGPDGRTWSAADLHHATLASLHGEFATVLATGEVLRRRS